MASVFSIGDAVSFINEKQNGVVLGFKSNNIIVVEIEDGFTLDVLAREIVVVKSAQVQAMGVPTEIQSKAEKKENTSSPLPLPDYTSHVLSNEFSLVVIPQNAAVLSGKLSFLLVNPFDSLVQGVCFEKSGNQLKKVAPFVIQNKGQYFVMEYSREYLMNISSLVFAFTISNDDSYSCNSKEIEIVYPGLVQHYPSLPAPYCFATTHLIYRAANTDETIDLSLLKDKFTNDNSSNVSKSNKSLTKVKNNDAGLLRKYGLSGVNAIVDLHIESLIEYPEHFSNGELMRIQLNHFRSELDKAMVAKMQSIVFIHGVGNGKLKESIEIELRELKLKYRAADFSKYGIGATEVLFN